ncbi:hypothetical protein ELU22_24560 [Salmonella enterica]|nr:hypothetical protein [Salmonella enterica]EAN8255298.1 hypothetical protein [Salmonella enterica]EAP8264304.1 hypothetical protein [Salmonella enterica]EAT0151907.1 hypothetical protein [Salmonella enterica]EBJ7392029.1 hypothetical protein [Salmonella enterica]
MVYVLVLMYVIFLKTANLVKALLLPYIMNQKTKLALMFVSVGKLVWQIPIVTLIMLQVYF